MLNRKTELRWWAQVSILLLSLLAPRASQPYASLTIMIIGLGTLPSWEKIRLRSTKYLMAHLLVALLFSMSALWSLNNIVKSTDFQTSPIATIAASFSKVR